MFTGLIADLGSVKEHRERRRWRHARDLYGACGRAAEGDSVAVNGVCLTATAIDDGAFRAQAMEETLQALLAAAVAAWLRESTWSSRCVPMGDLVDTSCKATSTGPARSPGYARRGSHGCWMIDVE